MELCRWSAGPTSWATSCVTVESNLSCFLVFRTLSRASCASLSLSRWKVSVSGSSRDRSFLRVGIASCDAGLYFGGRLFGGFGRNGG